jgi:hypothetical protein
MSVVGGSSDSNVGHQNSPVMRELTGRPGQGKPIQDYLFSAGICSRTGRGGFAIWYTRTAQSAEIDSVFHESPSDGRRG